MDQRRDEYRQRRHCRPLPREPGATEDAEHDPAVKERQACTEQLGQSPAGSLVDLFQAALARREGSARDQPAVYVVGLASDVARAGRGKENTAIAAMSSGRVGAADRDGFLLLGLHLGDRDAARRRRGSWRCGRPIRCASRRGGCALTLML